MKKITLLASASQQEELLRKLRGLGALHIRYVRQPSSEDLEKLDEQLSDIKKAVDILRPFAGTGPAGEAGSDSAGLKELVHNVIASGGEREDLIREIESTRHHLEWFKPWGAFNPHEIETLKAKGIFIRLYRLTRKAYRDIEGRGDVQLINRDKQYVYVVLISGSSEARLPYDEARGEHHSYDELRLRHEASRRRLAEIEQGLSARAGQVSFFMKCLPELERQHAFLSAFHGMKKEEKFAYLQGFCPTDRLRELTDLSKKEGFGYLIEDPSAGDEVPTLIRNPRWIRIISPVFRFMNTVPGYREYDISVWFLLFFSLFFAMLIGDAGYGLVFLAATFFARRKWKQAPAAPFHLLYVLSAATVIWGAVTGSWFGMEKIARLPFFNALIIDRMNAFVDTNQSFMIYFCFVIAVIHLSIAHLSVAIRTINSLRALSETGWILTLWGLFFLAQNLVLGKAMPVFGRFLLYGGIALILLFSNAQKNFIKGVLLSLIDNPLKIVSSFADIVSYLRLFAVGYASAVLAATFNTMLLENGAANIWAGLAAAVILFAGHALNVMLGLMSVIVHGIRLNMLEFSGHMGMEWSGKEYEPFKE